MKTVDMLEQAMTSYSTPRYRFSAGYYGAFHAYVGTSSADSTTRTW